MVIYLCGLTSYTSYIHYIFLLCLIQHVSKYHKILEARLNVSVKTGIKPYSDSEKIREFIMSIGMYLYELIKLAMYVFSIIWSPVKNILRNLYLSAVFSKTKNAIIGMFTNTIYYKTLRSIYCEKGPLYLLIRLIIDLDLFIECPAFKILCICFLCIYGVCVYVEYIPLLLCILIIVAIILLLSILYKCKSKDRFKSPTGFLLCFIVLLALLFGTLYCIRILCLWKCYSLFTKGAGDHNSNSGPNPGPSSEGPGGGPGGGPGDGPGGYDSVPGNPTKHRNRENDTDSDQDYQVGLGPIRKRRQRVTTKNLEPAPDSPYVTQPKQEEEEEKYFYKEGLHIGETPLICKLFQEAVFNNKSFIPKNTGEDTDYTSTSLPKEQKVMDDQSKANEWVMNYDTDENGNMTSYGWSRVYKAKPGPKSSREKL